MFKTIPVPHPIISRESRLFTAPVLVSLTPIKRNVGAVAELFDISCLVETSVFDTIQLPLFAAWDAFDGISVQDFIDFFHAVNPPEILAQHYFVANPITGQGVSPKWDFTSSGNPRLVGNPNAFIVAKGKGSVPAPDSTVNVNWLDVVNIGGQAGGLVADEVFRTDTVGGQPPSSVCITLVYAAFDCADAFTSVSSARHKTFPSNMRQNTGSLVANWEAILPGIDRTCVRGDKTDVDADGVTTYTPQCLPRSIWQPFQLRLMDFAVYLSPMYISRIFNTYCSYIRSTMRRIITVLRLLRFERECAYVVRIQAPEPDTPGKAARVRYGNKRTQARRPSGYGTPSRLCVLEDVWHCANRSRSL